MVNHQKVGKLLAISGFAFCILQIWLPQYFLTGDGPCHVYNAQVLHDLWAGKNTEFYSHYYSILYKPNPNWLSTLAMALLMFLVNGIVAEKIFLTVYVLVFAGGFYLLLKKINTNNPYWPLIIFIFVFSHAFFKGFYNFSFSIAFYFWMVWSWLRFLERRTILKALLFLLFVAFAFFTHLLAFVFGAFTCASLVISHTLANASEEKQEKKGSYFLKYTALLTLLLAPFVVMMIWFVDKEGGMQIQIYHHYRRLLDLIQFRYILAVTQAEANIAALAGIVLLVLFGIAFILRIKNKIRISKYDGFLLGLLFVLFVYLFFPEDFLGRVILINMRVQLYVFIVAACAISYMLPSEKIKSSGGVVLFGCFLVLSFVRIPCMLTASEAVAEYMTSASHIKPNSVIVPFNFARGGKDKNGKVIGDRNWLFCHHAEYLGLEKPMIVLGNYEANLGYFPLLWKPEVNPYIHLCKDEGIDGNPPYAVINEYKEKTGVTIDYILMWCYDPSALQNEHFRKLYAEMNAEYHIVYTSPTNRILLYEKNRR